MERFKIAGIEYLGHDALVSGDYGGAGSVGVANIRVILDEHKKSIENIGYELISDIQHLNECGKDSVQEIAEYSFRAENWEFSKPEVFLASGAYYSQSVYIRSDIWEAEEYGEDLENYPLLSDDEHSAVEMEWENEAFTSWAESDLIRSCSERTQEKLDDMLPGPRVDITWNAYRAAMETENEYPVPEYSGSHIPIDEIAETFEKHAITLLKGETIKNSWDKPKPDLFNAE
jgi:hypothetical protein